MILYMIKIYFQILIKIHIIWILKDLITIIDKQKILVRKIIWILSVRLQITIHKLIVFYLRRIIFNYKTQQFLYLGLFIFILFVGRNLLSNFQILLIMHIPYLVCYFWKIIFIFIPSLIQFLLWASYLFAKLKRSKVGSSTPIPHVKIFYNYNDNPPSLGCTSRTIAPQWFCNDAYY